MLFSEIINLKYYKNQGFRKFILFGKYKEYIMEDSILVICVDRDNDIGEKLEVGGPVFGRKDNLEVSKNLALEDPEESDANSIFGAIKEYDSLKAQNKKVNIATLIGDSRVGTISDEKIAEQLDSTIKKYKPKKAIFVSDGAEDDYILPILQSKLKILSVKKIIVKQSSQLESGYYMIIKFFKELAHDPQTSKLFLGIPAIILVLYAILGGLAWRFIFGLIGIYLVIKAFHLENFVNAFIGELSATLSKDKLSFFCYILTAAFIIIGSVLGYNNYNLYLNSNFLISALSFIHGSLIYYFAAGLSILTGRLLYTYDKKQKGIKYLTYYALLFSIYIVLENSVKYIILPDYNVIYLITSILLGFIIILIALITEKIAYSN